MDEKKISIIIPMYNAGPFIKDCIDSLIIQDYSNFEIIIVDDGSNDESPAIVKSYPNERIHYLLIENAGANNARNYGFANCSGDLIFFMDQDDFLIHNEVFKKISKIFELEENIDFVIFKYKEYFQKSNNYTDRPDFEHKLLSNSTKYEKFLSFVKNGNVPISPWDKVFKKDFLINSKIIFPVGLIAGDINWFIDIIEKSGNFALINEAFYAYRRQVSSSLTNSFSIKKFINFLHILEIESKNISIKPESEFIELYYSFLAYEYSILIAMSNNLNKNEFKNHIARIKDLEWLLKYDINIKVKKVKIMLNILGFKATSYILSQYIKKIVNKS
jgi:glycosyltransferase involved in cell wall biosynthesis